VARSLFFYTDSRLLGGAERSMFMLLEALDRVDWRPTLLLDRAPGIEPLAARAAELGVAVRLVEPTPLGPRGARRLPGLVGLLRRERPQVFHAHLSWPLAAKWPLAAAVAARVPAILATVQLIPEFELERSSELQMRALSRGVDRYLAVSAAIGRELADRFHWPREKIEVVYNAVELDRFGASSSPLRRELAGERPLVLTSARLNEQKGHPHLLAAAAEVPDAVFALAGEGEERKPLERLASRLGVADRVLFLGERSDMPELLAACDVFALPSLYEGSSLAVLEAMAARRPIVSSRIEGTDELLEDGESGLLVAPRDSGALAEALRRLLADRGLRERLGAGARARAEADFSSEGMARRVTEIYEEELG
jgi:glycosyltransferase involved in cell wall biosynthesis